MVVVGTVEVNRSVDIVVTIHHKIVVVAVDTANIQLATVVVQIELQKTYGLVDNNIHREQDSNMGLEMLTGNIPMKLMFPELDMANCVSRCLPKHYQPKV